MVLLSFQPDFVFGRAGDSLIYHKSDSVDSAESLVILGCAQKMTRRTFMRKHIWILSLTLVVGLSLSAFAQENAAPGKTPKSTVLIFREDFRANKGGEVQLAQDAIT